MSKSIHKKVGIASIIMMSSVLLSRLLGIVREMVIAYLNGTSGSVDAYQISFIIPEILNHVLASGFLSITFIPIFTHYLSEDDENEGWMVFSNILTCFSILLVILITITFFFAEDLISLTGISNPKVMQEAVRMTQIILPAQFFFFVGGLLMAVQFAKEQFLVPALAPLIYNLGIIVGGMLLSAKHGMAGFSWGVLGGAFLGNFVVQIWGAHKVGMRFIPTIKVTHPDLKKYIALTLPLMVGLTMVFSTEVIPKYFGSYLPEGSVSSLNYGLRIMFLLVGLFGQAVGVASYPFLARLATENKFTEMNQLLNSTLRHISLVIPFSVLVVILRYEVVFIVFQRGNFNKTSTEMTANILVFLMIGAFAFAAQTIVTRGYYAMQSTLFPAIYVTIAVFITLPFYFIGMQYMGVNGIALALSLSVMFQVILLFYLWNRKSRNEDSGSVYLFYLKMIVLSMGIGGGLYWFKKTLLSSVDNSTLLGNIGIVFIISLLFMLILILLGYFFNINEIFDIVNKVIKRKRKSRSN